MYAVWESSSLSSNCGPGGLEYPSLSTGCVVLLVCAAGARTRGQKDGREEMEEGQEAGNSSLLRSRITLA